MERADVERKLDELRRLSVARGLKLTHQRLEILRAMAEVTDHPSVDMVHARVRERIPTLSLDTVYRTVCTLEELGLVAKVCVAGDHGRYDADLSPHHHFVCDACHSIQDFAWGEAEALGLPPAAAGLGQVRMRQIILRGTCARCLGS